jgi:hypothetical protein
VKWRTNPFPWFDDIVSLIGELRPRKSRSFGSPNDALDDEESELEEGSNTTFRSTDPSDLRHFSQTQSEAPTLLDDTPNDDEDSADAASPTRKRHRPSAALEDYSSSKRRRSSGVGVMEEMIGEGLKVLAEAVKENTRNIEQVPKDTVDSTVEGQAQLRILEEASLTEEGQLLMIEMLTDPVMARTYLVFQEHEKLRVRWMRKQLQKAGRKVKDLFIDRDN